MADSAALRRLEAQQEARRAKLGAFLAAAAKSSGRAREAQEQGAAPVRQPQRPPAPPNSPPAAVAGGGSRQQPAPPPPLVALRPAAPASHENAAQNGAAPRSAPASTPRPPAAGRAGGCATGAEQAVRAAADEQEMQLRRLAIERLTQQLQREEAGWLQKLESALLLEEVRACCRQRAPVRKQGVAFLWANRLPPPRPLPPQLLLSAVHNSRRLVRSYGLRPWRALLELRRGQEQRARACRDRSLLRAALAAWAACLQQARWAEACSEACLVARARLARQRRLLAAGLAALQRGRGRARAQEAAAAGFRRRRLAGQVRRGRERAVAAAASKEKVLRVAYRTPPPLQAVAAWRRLAEAAAAELAVRRRRAEAHWRRAQAARAWAAWRRGLAALRQEAQLAARQEARWREVQAWLAERRAGGGGADHRSPGELALADPDRATRAAAQAAVSLPSKSDVPTASPLDAWRDGCGRSFLPPSCVLPPG